MQESKASVFCSSQSHVIKTVTPFKMLLVMIREEESGWIFPGLLAGIRKPPTPDFSQGFDPLVVVLIQEGEISFELIHLMGLDRDFSQSCEGCHA